MFETAYIDRGLWQPLAELLKENGWRIHQGKVRQIEPFYGMNIEGPWVFIRSIASRQCGKWGIWHARWNFIPECCWSKCWKVVVRLKTLKDLYALHSLANALNFPGKVGINKRGYVKGPYLGFFYSESEEEALSQKETISQNLKNMDIEYEIKHKQRCTEMNQSKKKPNPELENMLEQIFAPIEDQSDQPAWLKSAIMWEWNNFATLIGDETAVDMSVKDHVEE